MKIKRNRSPRALIALLPTLMLASPAFAQEAPTQTTTPPAPIAQSAPAPASAAPVFAPSAPVVQAVPDYTRAAPPPVVATVIEAPAEPGTTVRRAPAPRAARAAVAPRAEPVAPPAAAPVVAAPTATAPAATAPAAAEPVAAVAPVREVATDTTTTQTNAQTSSSIWLWIVGAGIVLLGLIALLVTRRRRDETVTLDEPAYEPAYEAPARAVPEPAMAAPLIALTEPQVLRPRAAVEAAAAPAPVPAEDTQIVEADDADVAALTQGHAPVPDRPWLEFAMRPVRAGTTSDEALVEIELTVGNAGSVMAEDVRISTFLFASEPADGAAFEELLLNQDASGADRVSIAAGEGTRIDATLALPKRELAALFNPVVVADARYRLPDGSEGRTQASFAIGMTQEDGGFGGIENDRPAMHDDIEARLHGTPQHA